MYIKEGGFVMDEVVSLLEDILSELKTLNMRMDEIGDTLDDLNFTTSLIESEMG